MYLSKLTDLFQDAKVTRLAITNDTTDKQIKALILNRQKSLRAPSFIYEKTLVSGYNEAVNEELFFGVQPDADEPVMATVELKKSKK